MEDNFELGQTVRDKVTGFEGAIVADADHYAGCRTFRVETESDSGGTTSERFDEDRIEDSARRSNIDVPETSDDVLGNIELGNRVRDTATGFEGIAITLVDRAFGVPWVLIQKQTDEESPGSGFPDSKLIDATQLEVVDDGVADVRDEMIAELEDDDTGAVAGEMASPPGY